MTAGVRAGHSAHRTLGQVLVLLDLLLARRLLLVRLLELEAVLGHADELLAVKLQRQRRHESPTHLLELTDAVLVDGLGHEDDLEALLLEDLQEGRVAGAG